MGCNFKQIKIYFICDKKRYANFGNVAVGYPPYAWQRVAVMLFCIFYIWNSWSSIMGRNITTEMCSTITGSCDSSQVSYFCFAQKKKGRHNLKPILFDKFSES